MHDFYLFFFSFSSFHFWVFFFSFSFRSLPLKTRKAVVGKRKFDGSHQNPGDPKRRYASGLILGNGGNNWGSQPLPQQPLGANGEQWYTDTYAAWS